MDFKNYVNQITLTELIQNLKTKFKLKPTDFYTGNCGTFAYALGSTLLEQGQNVSLIVVSNGKEEEDMYKETDIYHIFMKIENKYFDGIKVYATPKDAIKSLETKIAPFAASGEWESFEFAPNEWKTNKFIINLVHANTNYCISEKTWKEYIDSIVTGRKIVFM